MDVIPLSSPLALYSWKCQVLYIPESGSIIWTVCMQIFPCQLILLIFRPYPERTWERSLGGQGEEGSTSLSDHFELPFCDDYIDHVPFVRVCQEQ
jgi:hypothetical protein